MKTLRAPSLLMMGVLLTGVLLFCPLARAQTAQNYGSSTIGAIRKAEPTLQDKALAKVRWEQNLNTRLPLDAQFKDETGQSVRLGKYFTGKRPVVLAMIFYNCTMLCSEVLNGMMRSLKEVSFKPGQQYDVVIISIDPTETPALAAGKKKSYLSEYGFAGSGAGWHFLTGTQDNIRKVTDAAGYFYTYDKSTQQYAHPGGIVILTPEGKVTRYHTGVGYEPRDVKFSLIEAAAHKIGSPVDLILLRCFHYDPNKNTYSLAIMQVVRLAGALFVLTLGSILAVWVRRDMKKEKGAEFEKRDAGSDTSLTPHSSNLS